MKKEGWLRGVLVCFYGIWASRVCTIVMRFLIKGSIFACDAHVVIQSGVYPEPIVSGVPLSEQPSVLSSMALSWTMALW